MVALVDAMINSRMCTKFSSKDGPAAAIESAIDGGFNVGFEWAPQSYL